MSAAHADRPMWRAGALAVSAVLLYWLVDSGRATFNDIPLLTGLGFLAGAVAGGPRGGLWAPALVVSGWGLANSFYGQAPFDALQAPESAAHMLGMGLGLLVLAGLHRLGVGVSFVGVAVAVLLSGVLFVLQRGQGVELFNQPAGYALVLLVAAAAAVVTVRRR